MSETEKPFITVVTGLPRTGTSMMMRLLAAGGMQVLTDNQRKADDDNPGGYYELERVKRLKNDASWLADAQGKAIKVIYRLLYDLPRSYRYKVIFMKRDLREVIASQKVMLNRQRRNGSTLSDQQLIQVFHNEIQKIESWIEAQDHIDCFAMDFSNTINNPKKAVADVEHFLSRNLDISEMTKVVDPALHRQKI